VCSCLCAISVTLFFSHAYVEIMIRIVCDISLWFLVVLFSTLPVSVRVVWILRQALNVSRCVPRHRVLIAYPLRVIAGFNGVAKYRRSSICHRNATVRPRYWNFAKFLNALLITFVIILPCLELVSLEAILISLNKTRSWREDKRKYRSIWKMRKKK